MSIFEPKKIRNIAIIAHVDHGKTTLVDKLIQEAGMFRENAQIQDRLMDSMDLERERGITIAAKNASIFYEDYKINIIDTPGHADFSGEVERGINMVDGAILLVDAAEGPLPQTRFVLRKAFQKKLPIIVCINKVDRQDARPQEVLNEVFDLMIDLEATDEELNFEPIYLIAREGRAGLSPDRLEPSLSLLFKEIISKVPPPNAELEKPLQILISNISYNNFVGRMGVGKIHSGQLKVGDSVKIHQLNNAVNFRVSQLFQFHVNELKPIELLGAGDIGIVAGFTDVQIGDRITSVDSEPLLPRISVEEPTVGMVFSVNDGPLAGREGKKLTSRQILERLEKELLSNVSLRLEKTPNNDAFKVIGRGELQLGVLVETMRREGFELTISQPQVVFKTENNVTLEPMERVTIDVPESFIGVITEKIGRRKGILLNLVSKGSGRSRLEFKIPARGLIGYRSEFLTDTRGEGLMSSLSDGWEVYKGKIEHRSNGVMISDRRGVATAYALFNLQERGILFVRPSEEVYEGMIVGENSKEIDLEVNVCREKKLTNVRSAGADEKLILTPVPPMTLDKAIEFIRDDELVEVTPKSIRLRKKILNPHERKRQSNEPH